MIGPLRKACAAVFFVFVFFVFVFFILLLIPVLFFVFYLRYCFRQFFFCFVVFRGEGGRG